MKTTQVTKIKAAVQKFFAGEKRLKIIVIIGIAGIVLLLLSEFIPKNSAPASSANVYGEELQAASLKQYQDELEQRLCTMLSKVEGVGDVHVMITLETGVETVYAQDSQTTAFGQNKDPLVKTQREPEIRGVVVVCQGAVQPAVSLNVTELVKTALHIGANRVCVVNSK